MNCNRHPNRAAVAKCARCGAGVCAQCAKATAVTRQNTGVLCIGCFNSEMSSLIQTLYASAKKRLTRAIISLICYVFGVIVICISVGDIMKGASDGFPILAVGILLCGFYTGLTWRKAAQKGHDEYERKNGVTYNVTSDGKIEREDGFWTKLIFFIIGTVLGVIVTPIRFIIDLRERAKDVDAAEGLEELVADAKKV